MANIKQLITNIAFELGFDGIGITLADDLEDSNSHFLQWREMGFAADMAYLLREDPINAKPKKILPEAQSIISLLVNYYTKPDDDPGPDYGRVAAYAVGIDYHRVLRKKISQFQDLVKKNISGDFISKGFSDSVPLLEKPIAKNSGLGFFGKNTLIINRPFGSYFFICEIISNLKIDPTEEKYGTCGKCTRCIDICPTKALDAGTHKDVPLLDSRLCISYLTIENKGVISPDIRNKIGNWIFGCDLCQEVCPYNKKIQETTWKEFKPVSGTGHYLNLKDILSVKTDTEFRSRFSHTALSRAKRRGLIRNAAVVAGNNLSDEALPELIWLAENETDPLIKEHVLWALAKYNLTPNIPAVPCELIH